MYEVVFVVGDRVEDVGHKFKILTRVKMLVVFVLVSFTFCRETFYSNSCNKGINV